MKIAYLISAYKDPRQLARLVERLTQSGDGECFIHVDANVNIEPFRIQLLPQFAAVAHFTPKRLHVMWGGFNQVRYQMEMMRCCLDSGKEFDRIFIITGQDYPLWSHRKIVAELEANPSREYIRGLNISTGKVQPSIVERVTDYHPFRDFSALPLRTASHKLLRALHLHKKPYLVINGERWNVWLASGYMCITSALARHLLEVMTSNHRLMNYFGTSYVAEELVIPTIAFNSPFAQNCLKAPTEHYDGLCSLSAITYFDYSNNIKVWTEADYDELMASGRMFARKFESGTSDALIARFPQD